MRLRYLPIAGTSESPQLQKFLVENNENLDRLASALLKLETDSSSRERLSGIFRTIHSITGSCGFPGFSKLEKVAYVSDSLGTGAIKPPMEDKLTLG